MVSERSGEAGAPVTSPRPNHRFWITWRPLRMLVVGAAAAVVPGLSTADPAAPKLSIAAVHWGGAIAGPEVSPESLAGRVVLLEFWGIDCPPCAQTMPALERMYRALGPQGLVVVGAHVTEGAVDDVRRSAAALGVTFSIVGNTGVEGLEGLPGLPYTLVFDHTGACVFHGGVGQAGPAVTAAVNAAPPLVLQGRALTKLASLYPQLRHESAFGTALKKARGMTSSKDAETADEAAFVVETLESWARDTVDKAADARRSDPAAALARLQRCALAFKGEDVGAEALALSVAWKKDPAFRAEIKGCEQLAALESLRNSALGGAVVAAPDALAAVPPAVKRQMKDLADGIATAAPGSPMAERAAEISIEFGLDAAGQP